MNQVIYKVTDESKRHPSWSYNSVIYELNIRQFSVEGTLAKAGEHLGRLADLGVGIIWLMPIFPIGLLRRKGSLGSYYSISDYRGVNEEFGTLVDLRQFVDLAHSLGLRVILDWVANHTSRDARWVTDHPEWYEWDLALGEISTPFDWSDTAKLDFSNHQMRCEMVDSMIYWLDEADIDGFRCDMAMLVPDDFWQYACDRLGCFMDGQGRELFMLAEAEGGKFHRFFDATYGWELHHLFNRIARGGADCFALGSLLAVENSEYCYSAFRMLFTSNHDENSWNGSGIERFGDSLGAFAALSFILSGIPLIYGGEEFGLDRRLGFFDRDTIDWSCLDSDRGRRMASLYRSLCLLRRSHPALRGGELGGNIYAIFNSDPGRVFAVRRVLGDRVVVGIFNLSNSGVTVQFGGDCFGGDYFELGVGDVSCSLHCGEDYSFGPWGFSVYYR